MQDAATEIQLRDEEGDIRSDFLHAVSHALETEDAARVRAAIDALPPDLQQIFESTAERAHELLNKTIRKDDQKAYDVVVKKGIQPVEAGDAKAEWDAAHKKVRDNLTGRVFSKSLIDAVAAAAKP